VQQPVDRKAKDLSPFQLKELKATPERPAAELPKAMIPAGKRWGQLSVCRITSRFLLRRSLVTRLRFSDLIGSIAEIAWKNLRRKEPADWSSIAGRFPR
jgi:hypothetical protein